MPCGAAGAWAQSDALFGAANVFEVHVSLRPDTADLKDGSRNGVPRRSYAGICFPIWDTAPIWDAVEASGARCC